MQSDKSHKVEAIRKEIDVGGLTKPGNSFVTNPNPNNVVAEDKFDVLINLCNISGNKLCNKQQKVSNAFMSNSSIYSPKI